MPCLPTSLARPTLPRSTGRGWCSLRYRIQLRGTAHSRPRAAYTVSFRWKMTPLSAAQSRAADSINAVQHSLQVESGAADDLEQSAVAVCCSSASSRSRVSRATFVSSPPADELRGAQPLANAALSRCRLAALRFSWFAPALERRRIAAPRLRTRHRGEIRLARWSMVRHN